MLERSTAIAAYLNAMKIMREEVHSRVEAQTIMGFLIVARRGETTVGSVGRELSLTDGGASRLVSLLSSDKQRNGQCGYGLLVRTEDITDRRNKIVTLSYRGETLLARVVAEMGKPIEHCPQFGSTL